MNDSTPTDDEYDDDDVIILDWSEVAATETTPELLTKLERALGAHGIGLVAIRNVPDFVTTKASFLPMAHDLVHLPADYLEGDDMTDAASLYNAGWSHGKEKLGDKPDTAKGSFYYNPVTDVPGTPAERHQYPYSYPANKWPAADKLPGFRDQAVAMGLILKRATVELAKHIDQLASTKCADYPTRFLYQAMKDTDKVKARLLYYFPLQSSSSSSNDKAVISEDSWIGWHNDSGFLTALGGDLYVNHDTGSAVDCPDPAAGLYVCNRRQRARRVDLPADCLAVQIGECTVSARVSRCVLVASLCCVCFVLIHLHYSPCLPS